MHYLAPPHTCFWGMNDIAKRCSVMIVVFFYLFASDLVFGFGFGGERGV